METHQHTRNKNCRDVILTLRQLYYSSFHEERLIMKQIIIYNIHSIVLTVIIQLLCQS